MKKLYKKLSLMLAIVCVLSTISMTLVFAYSNNDITEYVTDNADILTDNEEILLEEKIDDIRKKYDYDIVIHTTDTYNGKGKISYADDYYDYNGFSKDGMILVINMTTRDYYTSTCGYGTYAFTDYGIDQIGDNIKPYLSKGNYYDAFNKYLNLCEKYLDKAHSGKPYDTNNKEVKSIELIKIIVGIIFVCFIISLIVTLTLKSKMNNVHIKKNAMGYEVPNSLNISISRDMFLYKHIDKHKIKSSSGSSTHRSSGSSTHRSSSGRSHGGGGGRF